MTLDKQIAQIDRLISDQKRDAVRPHLAASARQQIASLLEQRAELVQRQVANIRKRQA